MNKARELRILNIVLTMAFAITFLAIGAGAVAPVIIPSNTTYEPLSGGIANEVTPNFTLNVGIVDTYTGINISNVIADVSSVSTAGTVLMDLNGSLAGVGNITYFNKTVKVDKVVRGVFNVTVTAYDNSGLSSTQNLIVVAYMYPGVKVIGYNSSKNFPAHPANASMFYNNSPVVIIVNTTDTVHYSNVTANFLEADGSIPLEYNNSGVLLPDGNYSYRITHTLGTIPDQDARIVWINVTMSTPKGSVTIPNIGALVVVSNINPREHPGTDLGGDTTNFRDIPDYSAAYLVFEPFISTFTPSTGAAPSEQWNKTFGGTGEDYAYFVQQTSDGGYIIAGYSGSYPNRDAKLVKTDANGNAQWNKNVGVANFDDGAFSAQQTTDGGYILAGWTDINDIYTPHRPDGRLVKTDANGNVSWSKTFGGLSAEYFYSVKQTSDGGYIIGGKNGSSSASYDSWLIKTDANGNQQWEKIFAGTGDDLFYSAQQTSDGGYILAGSTNSYSDARLIKIDANGNQQWEKTSFGGITTEDQFFSVKQTSDGGYILAGWTFGGGQSDAWLIKTDANGNQQWSKTFGGINDDRAWSVQQTSDGGYIIAGMKGATTYGSGNADAWLIKTDANGNQLWNKTFGGIKDDSAHFVQQTSDGGYIVTGDTYSYGAGLNDAWLIKLSSAMPSLTPGKIATLKFNEPINLTDYTTAMNLKSLGDKLIMSGKSMNLNASADALKEFNKAATLTIYNLTAFTTMPGILQNGVLIVPPGQNTGGAVTQLGWDNSAYTLTINVSHWTEYSWDGEPPSVIPGAVGYPSGQNTVKTGQSVTLNAIVIDLFSGVMNVTVNATSIGAGLIRLSNTTNNVWSNTTVVNAATGNYTLNVIAYDKATNVNTGIITVLVDNNITPTPVVIKGDVNGDSQKTIVDALFIAQYTVGLRTLTSTQLASADVNDDGQVNIVDALFIAQYTVGLRQL